MAAFKKADMKPITDIQRLVSLYPVTFELNLLGPLLLHLLMAEKSYA